MLICYLYRNHLSCGASLLLLPSILLSIPKFFLQPQFSKYVWIPHSLFLARVQEVFDSTSINRAHI